MKKLLCPAQELIDLPTAKKLYDESWSLTEIGKKYNVAPKTVKNLFNKHNIKIKNRTTALQKKLERDYYSPELVEKIKNLSTTYTSLQISEKLNLKIFKVRRICKKFGISPISIRGRKAGKSLERYANHTIFLNNVNRVHENKFEYDLQNLREYKSVIRIKCPSHGWFTQIAWIHKRGHSCPQCGEDIKRLTSKDYLNRCCEIHNNYYNYSKINYKSSLEKILIICPKHGEFYQQAGSHLFGKGCSACGRQIPKFERMIKEFLEENSIVFEHQYKLNQDNSWFELDFYLPNHNIGIEINGVYWHSELNGKNSAYHLNKLEQCSKQNIRLIHIFTNLKTDKEIVLSRLRSILNLQSRKLYGRKCIVKELSTNERQQFFNKYHIQKDYPANKQFGLFYEDELVSMMSFGKLRKSLGSTPNEGDFELLRFCNKFGVHVIGGASKLLNFFEKQYLPSQIISYCDRCWSQGNVYYKLGFTLSHISKPNYYYFDKNGNLYHRYKFAKHTLEKQLPIFDSKLSEWENMQLNGYDRIWDCGNYVFTKEYNK